MNMQWDIVLHVLPFSNFHFPSLMLLLLLLLQTYSQLSQTTEQGIHLCLYSQSQHI